VKSRTKVAAYAATVLSEGTIARDDLVEMLAAWLKDTKHSRQATYLVQDLAKILAENGYTYVTVTTAHELSASTRNTIESFLKDYYGNTIQLEINEVVNPKIIGGIHIDTPHGSLDATVKSKLIQIIKGV
jgi:F0F1-type ATP synthase delta subunit